MGLASVGNKLLTELLPSTRKAVAENAAMRRSLMAGSTMAKDVITLNAEALKHLDRNVIDLLKRFNAELAEHNPQALRIKYANMAKSPRRFLSGQPELMPLDLKAFGQDIGAATTIQGDMHLHNYATVLKANGKLRVRPVDFDEATIGHPAFDFDRFVTHVVLTGREQGLSEKRTAKLIKGFASTYFDTLTAVAKTGKAPIPQPSLIRKLVARAKKQDPAAWMERRAKLKHGVRRLERMDTRTDVDPITFKAIADAVRKYLKGLSPDAAQSLTGFKVTDVVALTEGTGSIGRPRFRVLLEGGKHDEPIILQLKAQRSAALQRAGVRAESYPSEAGRGLSIGEVMDNGLDPFRGRTRLPGEATDFLVDRVRATDDFLNVDELTDPKDFAEVVAFYAGQAAKAHARGARVGLAGAEEILDTLGPRQGFIDSLVAFAHGYADKTEKDHATLVKALKRDPLLSGDAGR